MAHAPPPPRRAILQEALWYIAIGAFTTALYYGTWGVLFWMEVDYRLAAGIGYAVGSLVNFGLQKWITFRDTSRGLAMGGQFFAYWAIVGASLGATVLLVWLGVAGLGLAEWLSVIVTSAIMLAMNFSAHRAITFNPRLWDPIRTT
jgi:putative flippase GtrA